MEELSALTVKTMRLHLAAQTSGTKVILDSPVTTSTKYYTITQTTNLASFMPTQISVMLQMLLQTLQTRLSQPQMSVMHFLAIAW